MVRLRKIQIHARVNQGVGVVVGGVDGHYVGSDPHWCSATGPKRGEIGRDYTGCGRGVRNVVKWNLVARDAFESRFVNLIGRVASDSGAIKGRAVTCAARPQVAAA